MQISRIIEPLDEVVSYDSLPQHQTQVKPVGKLMKTVSI